MSSGIQGNYVDQAWAQNLPGYFKDNVKPSVADDAFLIPRANIAIPDIVTMSTVGAVGNRGFIDAPRTRLSTIRNAILNPSTYVKRLHPSDPTSGTGGIDNLSNLSRFGHPLPFADGEDFPDFQYWSRYTKDSGADPLSAGYGVKVIGDKGANLTAVAKEDRKQSMYKYNMGEKAKADALKTYAAGVEEDRKGRAERMADAAVLAAEETRRQELEAEIAAEEDGVEFVGANASFEAAAAMARGAPVDEGGVEFVGPEEAAPEDFAAGGEVPVEMGEDAAAAAAEANTESIPEAIQSIGGEVYATVSKVEARGYRGVVFKAADVRERDSYFDRKRPAQGQTLYRIIYLLERPGGGYAPGGYITASSTSSLTSATSPGQMCRYFADIDSEISRLVQDVGFRPLHSSDIGMLNDMHIRRILRQETRQEVRDARLYGGPLAFSDAGDIESIPSTLRSSIVGAGKMSMMSMTDGARSSTSMARSMAASSTAADEETYAPSGGDGASARSMSIAQSIAQKEGVRNILRDQAPILGPNNVFYQAEQRANIAEVQTTQSFMGSTTGNPAAIFSNAYIATPAFKRAKKQGVEGEYITTAGIKSAGRPGKSAQWGSMFEPRVEQTTAASGDVFSTAEREADPRYALLHGRKPSTATYSNPNLAYESGTMRQLESQARSNRIDGNVDGPAEQSSLAIQNPLQARNMASRVNSEFARAPPETRQTPGVLNKNQRIPVSSVTVADRASLTSDPAAAFRAGRPAPRR